MNAFKAIEHLEFLSSSIIEIEKILMIMDEEKFPYEFKQKIRLRNLLKKERHDLFMKLYDSEF